MRNMHGRHAQKSVSKIFYVVYIRMQIDVLRTVRLSASKNDPVRA